MKKNTKRLFWILSGVATLGTGVWFIRKKIADAEPSKGKLETSNAKYGALRNIFPKSSTALSRRIPVEPPPIIKTPAIVSSWMKRLQKKAADIKAQSKAELLSDKREDLANRKRERKAALIRARKKEAGRKKGEKDEIIVDRTKDLLRKKGTFISYMKLS